MRRLGAGVGARGRCAGGVGRAAEGGGLRVVRRRSWRGATGSRIDARRGSRGRCRGRRFGSDSPRPSSRPGCFNTAIGSGCGTRRTGAPDPVLGSSLEVERVGGAEIRDPVAPEPRPSPGGEVVRDGAGEDGRRWSSRACPRGQVEFVGWRRPCDEFASIVRRSWLCGRAPGLGFLPAVASEDVLALELVGRGRPWFRRGRAPDLGSPTLFFSRELPRTGSGAPDRRVPQPEPIAWSKHLGRDEGRGLSEPSRRPRHRPRDPRRASIRGPVAPCQELRVTGPGARRASGHGIELEVVGNRGEPDRTPGAPSANCAGEKRTGAGLFSRNFAYKPPRG